jgi:hypothetical protein
VALSPSARRVVAEALETYRRLQDFNMTCLHATPIERDAASIRLALLAEAAHELEIDLRSA